MKITQYNNSKTLLFVSGMFAGGWIWRETHPKIDNSQHLLIDDPLCALGCTIDALSDTIVEKLREVDQKVTMIGNSLGSFICLDVARKIPEKVDMAIISGSAGFGAVDLDIKLSPRKHKSIAEDLMWRICYDKTRVSQESTAKTSESFKENFRNILGLIRESNEASAEVLLSQVKCDVRAIWGANDDITPIDQAKRVFDKFGIPTKLIDKCGHSPMFERPGDFAECVNQYIN